MKLTMFLKLQLKTTTTVFFAFLLCILVDCTTVGEGAFTRLRAFLASSPYTFYGKNKKYFSLSCLNYSYSNEGLTLKTSAPYTNYGDNHKHFNLELSKLKIF